MSGKRVKEAMASPISPLAAARVRIDKWVWAARFFKTRSLAAQEVEKGHVRLAESRADASGSAAETAGFAAAQGKTVKPSHDVRIGDRVIIDIDRVAREFDVLGISDVRGSASVARTLYEETAASVQKYRAEMVRRKLYREPALERDGRPTKRDRRFIDQISDRIDD